MISGFLVGSLRPLEFSSPCFAIGSSGGLALAAFFFSLKKSTLLNFCRVENSSRWFLPEQKNSLVLWSCLPQVSGIALGLNALLHGLKTFLGFGSVLSKAYSARHASAFDFLCKHLLIYTSKHGVLRNPTQQSVNIHVEA